MRWTHRKLSLAPSPGNRSNGPCLSGTRGSDEMPRIAPPPRPQHMLPHRVDAPQALVPFTESPPPPKDIWGEGREEGPAPLDKG